MKVLYILHVAEMHGSIISILNTIKGVKAEGIEPVLVIPDNMPHDDYFMKSIEELGIKTYFAPLVQSIVSRGLYRSWSFKQKVHFFRTIFRKKYYSYKSLLSIVRVERPSIIHTNVGIIHEGFWVAKRFRIPHVFHIREYQDKDFGWRIIPSKSAFCWILKNSYVITITNELKKHFRLKQSSKALTIYNGIYPHDRTSMFFPKENYFFCASRISPEKGFSDVILAFAEFCKTHHNYKLLLAGDGDKMYIEELNKLALNNNCNGNVFFLGAIDNVYDYMQRARALIVGSYNEGFGRMTAEAAFAGCLVIGRNTGGTKEIIDKIGGYRFGTIEELIISMNKVAELPDKTYQKWSKYTQSMAVESFSTEQNVENTINLYHSVMTYSVLSLTKEHVKRGIGLVLRMISDNRKKKYNLGIVAIAKNEQDYIKEWVAFHKAVGFDKIILYNNDSTDNMVAEIRPFIEDGYVIYNEIHGTVQQLNAYNDALRKYSKLFRYLAFIDCDEFLFPVDEKETVFSVIEKTMKLNRHAGGIAVNWVMYGSSGHDTKPEGLLIENFLWRAIPPKPGTRWIKTVCNPDLVVKFDHPHYPIYKRGIYAITPKGKRCTGWCNPVTEYVGLRINHYFTKSIEQWRERRKFDVMTTKNLRSIDQFYEHDNNDILDKEILRYREALCLIMENYR